MQGRVLVPIVEIRPGWVVDRDIWHQHQLLLAVGVTITDNLLQLLKSRGIVEVEISSDSEIASYAARPADSDPLTDMLAASAEVYWQHGLKLAVPDEMLEEATDQVESFFNEIELGGVFDPESARPIVRRIIAAFTEQSHLAVKLLDLDRADRYTYRHSINVGLLYLMLSSDTAASEHDLEEVVFGAMLHDLGKARVGAAIINKPGPLNDDEKRTMHMHPIWSHEMLGEAGASPAVAAIARHHHERPNGQGYPDGLVGDAVTYHARLAAICDVYDAVTSKRSYKKKMDFATAVDILIRGSGPEYDPDLVHHFLRKVGRYPVGTFVRLSDNTIAVVLRVNEHAVSRPVVSRVMSAEMERCTAPMELDLSVETAVYINGIVSSAEMSAS